MVEKLVNEVNERLEGRLEGLIKTLGSALESRAEKIKQAGAEALATEIAFIHRQHAEMAARWSRKAKAALDAFNRA